MSEYFTSFDGIVLTKRPYREHDALVKIFTSEFGKRMFFIRGIAKQGNHPLKSSLNPLVESQFLGRINPTGLSFLKDASVTKSHLRIQNDPIKYAYGIYFMTLIDAAFEDGEVQKELFDKTIHLINRLEEGMSSSALQVLLETQLLSFFGVAPDWTTCQVSGLDAFDFPCYFCYRPYGLVRLDVYEKLSNNHRELPGILSPSSQAVALCQRMSLLSPQQLGQMNIKNQTYQAAKDLLYLIYRDFAGIQLKSRDYLMEMTKWFEGDQF